MVKFCRNCGRELVDNSAETCVSCGEHSVKASVFCRHCGKRTKADDAVCARCGASFKPLPAGARNFGAKAGRLMRAGKIVNLVIVVTAITAYVIFALPQELTKGVQTATGDALMASTGYTALPIRAIVAVPNGIPPLHFREGAQFATPIATNATRQLTIYTVRINTADNTTKATRLDEVTANCSFKSSNENIATVNASGFVRVKSAGQANITATYTAPAGTSNFTNAAAGKIPTTFTVDILVNAGPGGVP